MKYIFIILQDYFFELNCYNMLFYGIGLKFINASEKKYVNFNVEEYLKSGNTTPLVIFPEVIKTLNFSAQKQIKEEL